MTRPGRTIARISPLGSTTLQAIARVIGEPAAIRLSAYFGGRQLYVPHRPRPDSELVQVLGEDLAELLAKRYGGLYHDVPLGCGRRARLIQMRREGHTISAIAQEVGCTTRYVYQVLASYRADGGSMAPPDSLDHLQGDLFEHEEEPS